MHWVRGKRRLEFHLKQICNEGPNIVILMTGENDILLDTDPKGQVGHMDPSTCPMWLPISTNQGHKMLLFLAQIFVSHAGITNNGLAHTDSVWFCRF